MRLAIALFVLLLAGAAHAAPATYCNPMNLDYAWAFQRDWSGPNTAHRSTADPACVRYGGHYYLFSTNQEGYWWSDDLARWTFVAARFKPNASNDQVCAPGVWPTRRGLLFLPCFTERDTMPLYISTDPQHGVWREALAAFPVQAWDPQFFEDDDGRLFVYWGSSNLFPIRGLELDPTTYAPIGKPVDLLHLMPALHGWEQFGENNQGATMNPFVEGAWMNKIGGRYYLQYGAPGTEWNVYGDGVYVGRGPLGPFVYQEHNPFSWKPTGFIRGAGHGSTFEDRYGNLWHVASMVVGIKHKFERRLGLFPAGVDADGVLFTDTAFGDYPHYIPRARRDPHGDFTGWMLLSYRKKAWASASKLDPSLAFDEDIKTYWSAPDGAPGQFLAVDLGGPREVRALQINFAEEQGRLAGKQAPGAARHRYQVLRSDDGEHWSMLVDKSANNTEVPHDYVELPGFVKTRFLKLVNVEMPTGCFAVGDFRVFGRQAGPRPGRVSAVTVKRDSADRRAASVSWAPVAGAYAYEVTMGVAPDKLYTSILVYDATRYDLHALNVRSACFFIVRAVGETGLGNLSEIVKSP